MLLRKSIYGSGLLHLNPFLYNINTCGSYADFLPALEGRGFPPKGFIVPTIDSGLHLSFGGQSSGSENHSHLNRELSSHSSSPLKGRGVTACSSHSPIKPSIELGRSVISIAKRNFDKEIFKLSIRGYPSGEAFRPLNPFLCNKLDNSRRFRRRVLFSRYPVVILYIMSILNMGTKWLPIIMLYPAVI